MDEKLIRSIAQLLAPEVAMTCCAARGYERKNKDDCYCMELAERLVKIVKENEKDAK